MNWADLAQDGDRWCAVACALGYLGVPQSMGKFWTSLGPVSFSRTLFHECMYVCICMYIHKQANDCNSVVICVSN
jgi:hypothetical protein